VTKKDLMDLLEREAKLYRKEGVEDSLLRNRHMHGFRGIFDPELADAVLVDFINHVGGGQGLDLGLYTDDIIGDTLPKPSGDASTSVHTVIKLPSPDRCGDVMEFTPNLGTRCPRCKQTPSAIWDYWGCGKIIKADGPLCHFCSSCGADFSIETDYDDFHCDRDRSERIRKALDELSGHSGIDSVRISFVSVKAVAVPARHVKRCGAKRKG